MSYRRELIAIGLIVIVAFLVVRLCAPPPSPPVCIEVFR